MTHLLHFVIYCLIWYHFFQTQIISYLLDTGLHFALVADSVLFGPGQAKTKQNKTITVIYRKLEENSREQGKNSFYYTVNILITFNCGNVK